MKTITQASLYELKNVSQPQVAHEKIYFTQTQMNQEKNRYDMAIYAIDQKTKHLSQWGDSGSYNSQIGLSDDRLLLSFLSNDTDNEKKQLKIQSTTGGKAIQLTNEEQGVSRYWWSRDGNTIYYQTSQIIDEKKENESPLPEPTTITKTTYKLDGNGVLPMNCRYLLKKVNIETRQITELATTSTSVIWNYVSKDEKYALFTQEDYQEDEWAFGRAQVYKMGLSTQDVTCLTSIDRQGTFWYAAITEDETSLLVMGNELEYGFVTQNNLYRLDMNTGHLTNLTSDIDIELGDLLVADFQQEVTGVEIQWLNSRTFLFSATEEGRITLYQMTLDGEWKLLFNQPVHITGLSVLNEMKYAITYSVPTNPSALAIFHVGTGIVDTIYQPNETFLSEYELAFPEKVTFKGYNDWQIHGWYLPPVERQLSEEVPTGKHPAVLYVHGGPQVAYGETFFHEMQALSAMGYGVMMINPRGSNSYGQAFVASILGDYGNHDFDDLMLGVDAILNQHPEIDEEQLVVAGGSYGGFMTNWIVTHTNRFKAAVTQRSISNWISFYGTSDIGPFFVEYQLQADILQPERLWQMSPIAHVSSAKTPLLVLHGQEDYRCPQEQGEQMYIAMKKIGVPTKLITFPQSSHGLSRQGLPNLRQARLQAITDWFSQWLHHDA